MNSCLWFGIVVGFVPSGIYVVVWIGSNLIRFGHPFFPAIYLAKGKKRIMKISAPLGWYAWQWPTNPTFQQPFWTRWEEKIINFCVGNHADEDLTLKWPTGHTLVPAKTTVNVAVTVSKTGIAFSAD